MMSVPAAIFFVSVFKHKFLDTASLTIIDISKEILHLQNLPSSEFSLLHLLLCFGCRLPVCDRLHS